MAINTEKNIYTVLFACVMVIVVGTALAYLASGLKPRIMENERFEKQQNILYAMGVNENEGEGSVNFIPTDRVEEVFQQYIKEQYVLVDGELQEDEEAYLVDLKKQLDALKRGNPARLPVFIGEKDGQSYHIIPLYGKGLWDAIWGFISLDENIDPVVSRQHVDAHVIRQRMIAGQYRKQFRDRWQRRNDCRR